MNYIFGNDTISIEESVLCFIEGNSMSFGVLEVLFLMPLEDIFSHEWRVSNVWLFSHTLQGAQTLTLQAEAPVTPSCAEGALQP